MTTVRADRTQSKKGTLSDCEKDPRKYKGPVTSVTLKHKIVLRLCFCFPSVCSGQIELTPEFSLQRTILICLYASMSKQNKTWFLLMWLICHMLFVLVIVGLNQGTLLNPQV